MRSVLLAVVLACATVTPSAAADFVVTNTNAAGPGSLHQAITDANTAPGADRILFNIPGAGVHTIDVSQNPLPAVVDSLVIDGYSQPGAKPNSLTSGSNAVILIQIDGGGNAGATVNGLVFLGATSDYLVRGLSLTGFGTADTPGRGVAITAGQVRSAIVSGNFIGLLPDGEMARGNSIGVGHVTQLGHRVLFGLFLGAFDPGARNVISGNNIGFAGEANPAPGAIAYGAVVEGNYIGTNASGTKAVPNDIGVGLETVANGNCTRMDFDLSNTFIGRFLSDGSPFGNRISGNRSGIVLGRFECGGGGLSPKPVRVNGVQILANSIGLSTGGGGLPNGRGITIVAGSNNVIRENGIHYNGTGVTVTGGTESQGNQISRNSIFQNQKLGIDLGDDGVTANDINDTDTGPNNLQNHPVINSVRILSDGRGRYYASGGGTFHSTPNAIFRLEFFITGAFTDPSNVGKGEFYRGSTDVTTDASGNASFSLGFETDPGRAFFSATATDAAGNTSEFSPAFLVPLPQLVNLSTRSPVGIGENVLIGGFIIVGVENKKVMLRGLGPSMTASGVSGVLADPTLELHDSTGALLASNNNWKETQADEINATGIPPSHDAESALVANLPARPASQGGATYTGILAGNRTTTGIGLLEIYDLAMDANSKLVNISTRGFVGTGANALIGGFIPRPAARRELQLLIRALGPSLAQHGVRDPLPDPTLELHNANGATIVSNDNWRESSNASAIAATGIPPSDDRESAIHYYISVGTTTGFTAVVRGANGGVGVALVEIYALN